MKNTKNIITYLILAGLFIVPFIAFLVPSGMYFPFIAGKGFAFRILIEVVFGLYLILAFMAPEYRPKMSWITKAVLIFTLIIFIADIFGQHAYKSLWSNYERMEGFILIIHLVMYYIVLSSVFKTVSRWNQFFNTTIVASVIMSIYGVLQLMGKIGISQGGVRLDGTFGNASYLAIYLVFHIFLCMYMLFNFSQEKWLKWAYGIVALFETIVLYFTATRGAILGLIIGLLVTGVLVAWKERENKTFRKIAYSLIGAVFIAVLGFVALSGTSVVKNSPILSRFSTLSFAEFQTQGRYYVWPMAIKGVLERPILGWGQENFNFVFNKYYDPRMFGQEEWFDRTHNIVLDWLVAGGIVGFLAYASMYVAMFYYIWRKKSDFNLSEKSILTGMISAYIFHNMFVFDNLISYIIFFFILAFVHSKSTVDKEGTGKFYTKTFSENVSNYAVIPIVAILTIGTVYILNVPAILANETLIQAMTAQTGGDIEKNLDLFKKVYSYNSFGSGETTEQLTQIAVQVSSSQAPDTTKQDFYDLAKSEVVAKVEESPTDARYLVLAGSFFNKFNQYDTAAQYLTRALAESPKKISIYFELGSSYLGLGDKQKMFDTFKQAYELNPTAQETRIVYTIGAIYTKNTDILKEMSPLIPADVVISDNRFLQTYANVGDYNSVIAILSARLAKDPNNLQFKLSLASAYATIGNKQKAISLINEIIAQDPTFKAQGQIYINQIEAGK